MKIVIIVPGSGGTFYCENCLRDAALVAALRRRGHLRTSYGRGTGGALEPLLRDPASASELGQRGRAAVLQRFTVEQTAEKMIDLYRP